MVSPATEFTKIVSDPHGFLWFCTYDGLSRFDGYEFVNYSIEDGLPHRLVFDLLITRKGEYWVATFNGVARFNPSAATSNPKFRAYIPTQRSTSEVILDLYEDSSGTILAGTGNGLLRLRETESDVQFEYVNLGEKSNEELDITTIVEDSPGVVKADGGFIRIAYCSVTGNGTGISASGGTIGTMGNNMVVNNDIDIAGSINVVTFLPR